MAEYRVRAREMHPDKSGHTHDKDAFLKIQEAISVLGDDVRRSRYDEWIHSPLPLSFAHFEKNISMVRQSTHWATVPSTPMIDDGITVDSSKKELTDWKNDRYQSESAKKFRNFQI